MITKKDLLNVTDLDYFLNMSEVISVSISNAQSFEKAERLSVTDGLTGLANRQQSSSVVDKAKFSDVKGTILLFLF